MEGSPGRLLGQFVLVMLVGAAFVAAAGLVAARAVWSAGCWVIVARSGETVEPIYGLRLDEARRATRGVNPCLELQVVSERPCDDLPPARVVEPDAPTAFFTNRPGIHVVVSRAPVGDEALVPCSPASCRPGVRETPCSISHLSSSW